MTEHDEGKEKVVDLQLVKKVETNLERLKKAGITGQEQILALAEAPIDWVWEPYVVAGTTVIFGGGPGAGKTTFLTLLLVARAADHPIEFLGHMITPAEPGKWIVMIEPEQGEKSISRKLKRSCDLLGLPYSALDRIIVLCKQRVVVKNNNALWNSTKLLIREGAVSDVLLDTIASTTEHKANDEQEQAALFHEINDAARAPKDSTPPVIWIAAHTRKKGRGEVVDDEAADIGGSVQRQGQVDTVAVLQAKHNRDSSEVSHVQIFFDKLREDPPKGQAGSLKFRIVESGIVVISDGRKSSPILKESIFKLLGESDLTASAIETKTKAGTRAVLKALDELVKEKRVKSGPGTYHGKKTKVFSRVLRSGVESSASSPPNESSTRTQLRVVVDNTSDSEDMASPPED